MDTPEPPASQRPGTPGGKRHSKRTVGQSAGLSSDEIRDKAMELIEAEGVDALTMRRLAAEFGVTPMSLYHHVGNKEELTAALQRGVLDTLEFPSASQPWESRLRSAFEVALTAAITYPQLAHAAVTTPVNFADDDQLFTEMQSALIEAGIPDERVVETFHGIVCVPGGSVLMITTGFHERVLPDGAPFPTSQPADIAIAYVKSEVAAHGRGPAAD